jgi:hypothetical protein
MSSAILFEDIFDVRQMNPDGKKFERGQLQAVVVLPCPLYDFVRLLKYCLSDAVNRLHGRGSTYDVDLVLGITTRFFSHVQSSLTYHRPRHIRCQCGVI